MKKTTFIFCALICLFSAQALSQQTGSQQANKNQIETAAGPLEIHPINHATMALTWNDKTLYVDPTGGAEAFADLGAADFILITDIHGDHLNIETLKALNTENAVFIVPQAVADRLPDMYDEQITVLNNGESMAIKPQFTVKAIPMYNLPQSDDAYHIKGRGNGYLLTIGDKRIYIAGDTEGIPEMRSLENIDLAFIPMNLPYTMDVEQAADAVLDFAPSVVYPYHYGDSDAEKFKELVTSENSEIEVRLIDWYPEE